MCRILVATLLFGLTLSGLADPLLAPAHAPENTAVTTESLQASDTLRVSLDKVAEERDLDKRLARLADIAKNLPPSEFSAALDQGATLKELRERVWFQENTLNAWADKKPKEVMDYLMRMPDNRLKANALRYAVDKFAKQSPSEAGAMAAAIAPGLIRNDVITQVAHTWAQADVTAALAWVETLPESFVKNEALTTVRYVWVNSAPITAAPHVEKLPESETNSNLAGVVAYGWAALDLQAATRWVEKLPAGPKRRSAYANLAESWSNTDPKGAAEFALKIPDFSARPEAVALVAGRWAKQNPEAAAAWAWSLVDEDTRNRALFEVFNLWGEYEPDACVTWVEKQPASPVRARGLEIVATAISSWRPARAIQTALLIEDGGVSDEIIRQSVTRWMEQDAAAARAWLKSPLASAALRQIDATGR